MEMVSAELEPGVVVPTIGRGSVAKPGSAAGIGLWWAPPEHGGLPGPHQWLLCRQKTHAAITCTLVTSPSCPRAATDNHPSTALPLTQRPVPLLAFVHSQTLSKTKANSLAAEGAIFMARLNEEVFFDLLKILNII